MVASLSGSSKVAGIAAATGAAPAPKVFSTFRGMETFSNQFTISWMDASGSEASIQLTPERYTRLKGPYNRRNVYGAAVAFGPILAAGSATHPMYSSVARYSMCNGRPLLAELGVNVHQVNDPVTVQVQPAYPVRSVIKLNQVAPCK